MRYSISIEGQCDQPFPSSCVVYFSYRTRLRTVFSSPDPVGRLAAQGPNRGRMDDLCYKSWERRVLVVHIPIHRVGRSHSNGGGRADPWSHRSTATGG